MELDLAIGELLVVDKHGLDLIGVAFILKDKRRICERSAHIVKLAIFPTDASGSYVHWNLDLLQGT